MPCHFSLLLTFTNFHPLIPFKWIKCVDEIITGWFADYRALCSCFRLFKIQHISPWMFSSTQLSARFREFISYCVGWNPKEWYQRIMVGGWVCVCLCLCIHIYLYMCVLTPQSVSVCAYLYCVCEGWVCVCVVPVFICLYLLKCACMCVLISSQLRPS